jgi:hypothetical protein
MDCEGVNQCQHFLVYYLTTLSVSKPYNEYVAVGGIGIGKGNQSSRRKPAPVSLVHHEFHSGLNPRLQGENPAPKRLNSKAGCVVLSK